MKLKPCPFCGATDEDLFVVDDKGYSNPQMETCAAAIQARNAQIDHIILLDGMRKRVNE